MSLLYEKESFEIRGACFWLWKEFGSAFKESIIDKAFTQELTKRGLKVESQKRINIYYEGKKVGTYIPDKVVNDSIIIELKSKPSLTDQDIKQFWHYLKGTPYKLGFLINFGQKLEIKRVVYDEARIREKIGVVDPREDRRRGFTLVEIIVATTIFAVVVAALMALFNYTLKINRRAEALRQATQGMRNFVEFLVKEVRNGDIDYGIIGGTQKTLAWQPPLGPCNVSIDGGGNVSNTYTSGTLGKTNWLGIITTDNEEACVYFADYQGNAFASNIYTCSAPSSQKCTLVMEKYVPGGPNIKEIINPPNYKIDSLAFFVRPVCDPLATTCLAWVSNPPGLPKVQPSVTIAIKFIVNLPTGETVPIYYQTTITSGRTDIPSS